ncbi:MAG: ATP-dependent helicase [Actinomycetota bacterium]
MPLLLPLLGRSLVVSPGQRFPDEWSDAPRVVVGAADAVSDSVLDELENSYLARTSVVIELAADLDRSATEVFEGPVWSLSPDYSFPGERLAHAVWANSIDLRGRGHPRWALEERAISLGAHAGGPADVVLSDGRPAFCDGGPLRHMGDEVPGRPGVALINRFVLEHGSLMTLGGNQSGADLAADQRAAVTHPGGAARIIAPAGSGKTRVLTERARHLLKAWGLPANMVCLVAFNKRAAEEMVGRTRDLPGLQVRTINSLALAIVSGTGPFGGGRPVQTIDERGVRDILDNLVSFSRRMNTDPAAAWIEALSAVRMGLRSPRDVETEFDGDVDGLVGVFEQYRQVLAGRNFLDFDEQIYRAIEMLVTDPLVRSRARLACRMMLVDEFQDLTPAHLLLIRLLAGPDGAVFGVGDDDQTIYGYSDASPDWLIDYIKYFPAAGNHNLEVNYRCPPPVVEAARVLLTHNRRRVEKTIRSSDFNKSSEPPRMSIEVTEDPVAATMGAVLAALAAGAAPKDIAVLTRINNSLAPVQIALGAQGVAVNCAVNARFMERTGVKAALAWLRIASQPGALRAGDIALTVRRPPRGLSPKVIEWMGEQPSLERLEGLAGRLSGKDQSKILTYVSDIAMLAKLAGSGPGSVSGSAIGVFQALRDEVGLADAIAALDASHRRLDRSPHTDDVDILVELARLHPDPAGFEKWLREGLARPSDPQGVTLATVHSVKGREWDHVVVHHATQGLMPHRLSNNLEEERRVFHVAITRCRLGVTIVGGEPPSRFLAELASPWVPPPVSEAPEIVPSGLSTSAAPVQPKASPGPTKTVEALKAWRLDRSRAEARPAFTVLHDSTLEAIAASQARTLSDLAAIKGIGPAKLEAFGDEILAILEVWQKEAH